MVSIERDYKAILRVRANHEVTSVAARVIPTGTTNYAARICLRLKSEDTLYLGVATDPSTWDKASGVVLCALSNGRRGLDISETIYLLRLDRLARTEHVDVEYLPASAHYVRELLTLHATAPIPSLLSDSLYVSSPLSAPRGEDEWV